MAVDSSVGEAQPAGAAKGAKASGTPSVADLLSAGKCKQAVELAKDLHKAARTPESEAQLVTAYLARIEQFQSKGMTGDADTLIGLVQQRFPDYRDRLATLRIRAAAGAGRVDELVAPLARSDTPAEVRAAIESVLRQEWIDLPALAACVALPADHPLRVAAAAVHRAFEAVTTGPTDEAALALPEVSFRSPLAGWKLLVRAIGAFYRNDDFACRRALEGIPADAAVRRLAPALTGMLDRTPAKSGHTAVLQARVAADDRPVRAALEAVETILTSPSLRTLHKAISTAINLCAAAYPDRCERLRQHIVAACLISNVSDRMFRAALAGTAPANAYFWRMFAREAEAAGQRPEAAVYWNRFLVHAVAEGLFPAGGAEAAEVYRRAAGLLATVDPEDLADFDDQIGPLELLAAPYVNQPPEILALVPQSEKGLRAEAMSVPALLRRAIDCRPDRDSFQLWWQWSLTADEPEKSREAIATLWHEKRPGDAEPLLHLSDIAEGRNALVMAAKHLASAEAIDPMNPAVRRARLRLTVAILLRHFREKKPHLVAKDLTALAGLPGMAEGDRAAGLTALRCGWAALAGDAAAEADGVAAVVQHLGPVAARALLDAVGDMAKLPAKRAWVGLPPSPALPDAREVARADARLIALATDLGLKIPRPRQWDPLIDAVLRERPCPLSVSELLAIGRSAADRPHPRQAYLASVAGLAATAAGRGGEARFLVIRSGGLVAYHARARAVQCLRAALELARQANDADLIAHVLGAIDLYSEAHRALSGGRNGEPIGDELLAEVLKAERAATTFPTTAAEADRHLVLREPTRRPELFFGGGFDDDDDDDDDDDHDVSSPGAGLGFDPGAILGRLSPASLEKLKRVVAKLGRFPSPVDMMGLDPQLMVELLTLVQETEPGPGTGGRGTGRP